MKIFLLLSLSKLIILFVPFKKIVHSLGSIQTETNLEQSKTAIMQSKKIRSYITTAIRFLPWESKCYDRAITAKVLLNRLKIPATLYFGVALAKENKSKLDAHAWVRCGRIFVTGGKVQSQYMKLAYIS